MNLRWPAQVLSYAVLAVLPGFVLLGDWFNSVNSPNLLRSVGLEIQAACRDAGTQWMVVVCLVSYFITFAILRRKADRSWQMGYGGNQSNVQSLNATNSGRASKAEGREQEDAETGIAATEGGVELSMSNVQLPTLTDPRPSPRAPRLNPISYLLTSISSPAFWLAGFVLLVLLRYAVDYANAARSLQVVVLLTGIVVGKGIGLWVGWGKPRTLNLEPRTSNAAARGTEHPTLNFQPSTFNRAQAVLIILTILLAVAALWHPERGMEFFYRGQPRWTGPWDNPNLFGVLMGVGTVLAVGLLVSRCRLQVAGCKPPVSCRSCVSWLKILFQVLLFSAAGMCAYGLIKSYSRGAWLGTVVGMGFLAWKWLNHEIHQTHEKLTPQQLSTANVQPSTVPKVSCLSCVSWLRTNWLPAGILLLSILVICFWQFRHTEAPLARRLFSVGNVNDFSWRNRVVAWEGAGRMMLDKPVFGFGWGKAEEVYSKQYRVARLEEAAAIQMNDYLMLGISAGIPVLLCLLVYLGLVLRQRARGQRQWGEKLSTFNFQLSTATAAAGLQTSALRVQATAVAASGALVLLIGFWFDGGLFKLPTAVVFWVLIELGRQGGLTTKYTKDTKSGAGSFWSFFRVVRVFRGPNESVPAPVASSRLQMGLRWLAGGFAVVALGLTALHLITAQLAVSDRTLGIARKFIVPPGEKADFEYLVTKPIWSNQPLKVLLQHAHLANYNRTLVNWKLSDELYHEFVLSPELNPSPGLANTLSPPNGERAGVRGNDVFIVQPPSLNSQPSTDLNWRRPLWEFFYPRIRKESNLAAAAEIVIRQLREQVKPSQAADAPTAIMESWQRGAADEAALQKLTVAVLRSVGIPARLTAAGPGEFWDGAEWKAVSSHQSNR